jgi:hypothetical protein
MSLPETNNVNWHTNVQPFGGHMVKRSESEFLKSKVRSNRLSD